MTTPTPRTDAQTIYTDYEGGLGIDKGGDWVCVDFARQLERELVEANEKLDRCVQANPRQLWNIGFIEQAKELNFLRQQLAELQKDKERLDWLEKDGNLRKLWGSHINLKDFVKETWDVRTAIDVAILTEKKGRE